MQVVVCGAGVIGCATAYYLSLAGAEVTIVECDRVASGASGKSGGFLALDWCRGTAVDQLTRHPCVRAAFTAGVTKRTALTIDHEVLRIARICADQSATSFASAAFARAATRGFERSMRGAAAKGSASGKRMALGA